MNLGEAPWIKQAEITLDINKGNTRPYRNRVEVFGVDTAEGFPKVYGGRFKTGGFGVFGGGTDGDDLVAAAKREYLEETGYTLTDVEKMPIDAVTVEWKPPYKSAKQAERAKTYRGTRTWYMYGVITGPKVEKAEGEDGASPLDNVGFYTCKTALEMLQGSTTENAELLPQIEARKKALLFVIAKSFGIKLEKLAAEKTAEITLDINKGDVLLGGKYKNSPITVEDIGTDELGQPTVNGKKLLSFRIKKKMPEKISAEKTAMRIFSLQTANRLRPLLEKFLKHDASKIQALRDPMSMVSRKIEVLPNAKGARTIRANGMDFRQPFSTEGLKRMAQIMKERAALEKKPPKRFPRGHGTAGFIDGD